MTLFGDPLVEIGFEGNLLQSDTSITENDFWIRMSQNVARIAAQLYRKSLYLKDVLLDIVGETGKDLELAILYSANTLYNNNNRVSRDNQMASLMSILNDYIVKKYKYEQYFSVYPDMNQFLTENGFKISRLLYLSNKAVFVSESNLLDEGWWQFNYVMSGELLAFVSFFFQLEIYQDSNYTILATNANGDLVGPFDSRSGSIEWEYEYEKGLFTQIPIGGVSTSYSGRRIRYTGRRDTVTSIDQYLTRGQTYYFRIRQYYMSGSTPEYFNWTNSNDIIYT
jgi:hypothetical protein